MPALGLGNATKQSSCSKFFLHPWDSLWVTTLLLAAAHHLHAAIGVCQNARLDSPEFLAVIDRDR